MSRIEIKTKWSGGDRTRVLESSLDRFYKFVPGSIFVKVVAAGLARLP
jgi:hypothetical protein